MEKAEAEEESSGDQQKTAAMSAVAQMTRFYVVKYSLILKKKLNSFQFDHALYRFIIVLKLKNILLNKICYLSPKLFQKKFHDFEKI